METSDEAARDFAHKLEWYARLLTTCWGTPPQNIGKTITHEEDPLFVMSNLSWTDDDQLDGNYSLVSMICSTEPTPQGYQGSKRGEYQLKFRELRNEWVNLEIHGSPGLHDQVDELLAETIERLKDHGIGPTEKEIQNLSGQLRRLAEEIRNTSIHVKQQAGTGATVSTSAEIPADAVLTLESIEKQTPGLDKLDRETWCKASELKQHGETASPKSLREQRSRGKKNKNGSFGVCKVGRIWRKDGQDVWYYVSALLSNPESS